MNFPLSGEIVRETVFALIRKRSKHVGKDKFPCLLTEEKKRNGVYWFKHLYSLLEWTVK